MSNPLRKTMVYLGLADEEVEHDTRAPASAAATAPAPAAQRAPVTPLRRAASSRQAPAGDMNEILTVHPRLYKDAQVIAESFREGIPVIMNLSQMTESEAQRLVDFASGLSQGLYGRIERVTSKVFLLSPAHVATTGDTDELDSELDASFSAHD